MTEKPATTEPIKRGTQISMRVRTNDDLWRIEKVTTPHVSRGAFVSLPSGGGLSRAEEGTRWVRGWEGPVAEALNDAVVADNEKTIAVRKELAEKRTEQERVANEKAAQERHTRVVAHIAEAVAIVDAAKVPDDLREAAFKFALMTGTTSPYTFVWK